MIKHDVETGIGGYPFCIKFVPPSAIPNCDGSTFHNDRVIKIRDDLNDIATELVLRHEITHAILGTQGRAFQRKFDVEELCEFVAYQTPFINNIMSYVLGELDESRR